MTADTHPAEGRNILFLDGDCLFCRRSARLLHRWNRRNNLFFATLQGETAAMLPADRVSLTDARGRPAGAAVLMEHAGCPDQRCWSGADAVLRAFYLTGGIRSALWLLHYTPRFLKSGMYHLIARNRHHIARTRGICPLPEQDFKDQFMP